MTLGAQTTPTRGNRTMFVLLRLLAMVLLFCTAAVYEAVHLSSLSDPDIWQHLRTGMWILENHAVPQTGLFSQFAQLSWMSSSWGFDALLAAGYTLVGLRVVPLTLMLLKIALAVSAFLLASTLGRNFGVAIILAIAVQCALPALRPLPNLCSVVCFSIELLLLFVGRRTGNLRTFYWLPVLFVFWVNLHLQFVCGLLVLGLWGAAALTEHLSRRSGSSWCDPRLPVIPMRDIGIIIALCFAATLLSPYGFHIYEVLLKNAHLAPYVPEDHSMNFRHLEHYLLFLLAMMAFFVLGRRHSRDLFQFSLMIAASMLAFRIQGEAGFLVMASVAVIADAFACAEVSRVSPSMSLGNGKTLAVVVLLVVVTVVAFFRIPSSKETLLNRMGESLPVRACDYIRLNQLPNPLFNEYRWGSFLTFYLPGYPVALDGRTDLYGEEIIDGYFKVTNGAAPLNSDPTFADAKTVLLPANSAATEVLTRVPDFKLVYRDDLAAVLVKQE